MEQPENEVTDLITGLDAIAVFLRIPTRRAKHWHGNGTIPTFKVGDIVCARRSTLAAWLAEREKAGRVGQ